MGACTLMGQDGNTSTAAPGTAAGQPPNTSTADGNPGRGSRVPAGHTRVAYYLDDESHAKLQEKAKADEREVDDYARLQAKYHAHDKPKPSGATASR
jgi:hypothetical protein